MLPVYGAGVADGRAYLVMRYVDGDDLRTLVRRVGPLTAARAAEVTVALGDALDAIHRAGYIHRDVKPANVLLDASGHVYLSDFGLAKQALASAGLTESDRWVGTLDYAAPEQIRGGKVDARADVYALGGVLHFMLTGAVPFDRESDEAKLWAHLSEPPPLPSALRPDLPAGLDDVVQRALAKEPEERHPSAGDMGRAARSAAGGGEAGPERTVARGAAAPEAAPSVPGLLEGSQTLPARRADAGAGRRRRLIVAGAALALAIAAVTALLVNRGDDDHADRAAASATPEAPRSAPSVARVGKTLTGIGSRPRDIAVVGGDIWVTSATRRRLARIGASSMRRHGTQPLIGRGAVSIAAHGDTVWVAISRQGSVTEIDSATGLVRRRLPIPVTPILVAAGADGLWVAGRRKGRAPDVLFHYDRAGRRLATDVPNDITALTVGGGFAWVAHDGVARLLGFDARLRVRHRAWLLSMAHELTYGDGRLWTSEPADDSLGRYDLRKGIAENLVAPRPTGLAVAGGRVFVASNTTKTVVVVDQDTLEPVGDPISVPLNPWGVEAGAGHVWVSGLGENTLSRIDY